MQVEKIAQKTKRTKVYSFISCCLISGVIIFAMIVRVFFPRPQFDPNGTKIITFILLPLIIISTVLAIISLLRIKKYLKFSNIKKEKSLIYLLCSPIFIFWIIISYYITKSI